MNISTCSGYNSHIFLIFHFINTSSVLQFPLFPGFPFYKHIQWFTIPTFSRFSPRCVCMNPEWTSSQDRRMLPMRDDWEPFKQGSISRFLLPTSGSRYQWVPRNRTVFGVWFKEVRGFVFVKFGKGTKIKH